MTFKYDPFGRRIEKTSPNATSIFAYDGANLVETVNASGGVVARYTQGGNIDQPLAELRGSTTDYYEADGLGSITSLTDTTGALAKTYTYDSFGNTTASTGSVRNYFQYTGREFDTETNLYYYRARYYDPAVGRFLSEDPKKESASGSLYGYTENSPVLWSDPFGTQAENSGFVVGPQTTPQQVSQFNAGFAEALNRLKNSECLKLFCQKKKNLDPSKALHDTEYRVLALPRNSSGAQKNTANSVFIGQTPLFPDEYDGIYPI